MGIVAIDAPNHHNHIHRFRQGNRRSLPILGGLADRIFKTNFSLRKLGFYSSNQAANMLNGLRSLGDNSKALLFWKLLHILPR